MVQGTFSYVAQTLTVLTVLTQRGDFGRTPWTNSIDASVAYIPGFADG